MFGGRLVQQVRRSQTKEIFTPSLLRCYSTIILRWNSLKQIFMQLHKGTVDNPRLSKLMLHFHLFFYSSPDLQSNWRMGWSGITTMIICLSPSSNVGRMIPNRTSVPYSPSSHNFKQLSLETVEIIQSRPADLSHNFRVSLCWELYLQIFMPEFFPSAEQRLRKSKLVTFLLQDQKFNIWTSFLDCWWKFSFVQRDLETDKSR